MIKWRTTPSSVRDTSRTAEFKWIFGGRITILVAAAAAPAAAAAGPAAGGAAAPAAAATEAGEERQSTIDL